MPYRRTKSLSKGRREEREKQLNIHRPIKSGIDSSSAVKVGSVQNDSALNIFLGTGHPECRPAEPTTKDLIRLQKGVILCS